MPGELTSWELLSWELISWDDALLAGNLGWTTSGVSQNAGPSLYQPTLALGGLLADIPYRWGSVQAKGIISILRGWRY